MNTKQPHNVSTEDKKSIDPIIFLQLSNTDENILNVLYGKELYGLQIIEAFNKVSKGAKTISIGTLYPMLSRLEKQGLIASRVQDGSTSTKSGARRKYYKVTQSGSFALSEKRRFQNELQEWKPDCGEPTYA
jgi:PadR family transcriptional regulator, regulatory protein PadR